MLPALANVRPVHASVNVNAKDVPASAKDAHVSVRAIKGERMNIFEKINRIVKWSVMKWNTEDFKAGRAPYEIMEFDGNCLLDEGMNNLWTLACGGGTAVWGGSAYLGVGDSNTTEYAYQTGLQGANKAFKSVNGGYPQYGSSNQAVWQSDFGNGEGEFDWQEFTVSTSGDDGINLNRKVQNVGVKTSGKTWRLTLTITFS
jgi:hypothetical protein